jgi:hypothetical protein
VFGDAARGSILDSELRACEFLAAFGSDGWIADEKTMLIADTDLRTISGAGHQHFLGFMRELQAKTDDKHLASALFRGNTSTTGHQGAGIRTIIGHTRCSRRTLPVTRFGLGVANHLPIEALPLFPTMPRIDGLYTSGFDEDAQLSYPVWTDPIDIGRFGLCWACRR